VSEVYPFADLHTKVIEVAKEITNKPLSALIAAKQVIKENENLSMREGQELERRVFYPLYDTQGVKEGVNAFVEKRKPNHFDL
jgi:enoyl-CoA hydratase/carnithine racemase